MPLKQKTRLVKIKNPSWFGTHLTITFSLSPCYKNTVSVFLAAGTVGILSALFRNQVSNFANNTLSLFVSAQDYKVTDGNFIIDQNVIK